MSQSHHHLDFSLFPELENTYLQTIQALTKASQLVSEPIISDKKTAAKSLETTNRLVAQAEAALPLIKFIEQPHSKIKPERKEAKDSKAEKQPETQVDHKPVKMAEEKCQWDGNKGVLIFGPYINYKKAVATSKKIHNFKKKLTIGSPKVDKSTYTFSISDKNRQSVKALNHHFGTEVFWKTDKGFVLFPYKMEKESFLAIIHKFLHEFKKLNSSHTIGISDVKPKNILDEKDSHKFKYNDHNVRFCYLLSCENSATVLNFLLWINNNYQLFLDHNYLISASENAGLTAILTLDDKIGLGLIKPVLKPALMKKQEKKPDDTEMDISEEDLPSPASAKPKRKGAGTNRYLADFFNENGKRPADSEPEKQPSKPKQRKF